MKELYKVCSEDGGYTKSNVRLPPTNNPSVFCILIYPSCISASILNEILFHDLLTELYDSPLMLLLPFESKVTNITSRPFRLKLHSTVEP